MTYGLPIKQGAVVSHKKESQGKCTFKRKARKAAVPHHWRPPKKNWVCHISRCWSDFYVLKERLVPLTSVCPSQFSDSKQHPSSFPVSPDPRFCALPGPHSQLSSLIRYLAHLLSGPYSDDPFTKLNPTLPTLVSCCCEHGGNRNDVSLKYQILGSVIPPSSIF